MLSIVDRLVRDLKLDPNNPRLHTQNQIRQIARSIETFGFNVPVLIDAQGQLIAGHGRVLAARLLGMAEVPTIQLVHLTEGQIRAFMIADNRLTENSVWNERLLAEQFKALSVCNLDFSIEATGFEMGEIDMMIENLEPATNNKEDLADSLPDPSLVQVSGAGDLWQLGKHRVLCGDAVHEESYLKLMEGLRAAAVFSDPPYNDKIDGYVTGFGKVHHSEFVMASGEMSEAQFIDFLLKTFRNLARNSERGSLHFIFLDWRHAFEILEASRRIYSEFKNLCVWVKESGGQGSFYRSRHELVFVFKNGKTQYRNNIQLGQYGRYRTNVWEYPRVTSSRRNDKEELSGLHPTIKPAAMVADAILDCTSRNDIILDPFLGSGTTVVAAERTGRVCYGMELDPVYVDTAIRRWQRFTSIEAIHQVTGQTFAQREEERRGA
jgi:DNA modification methylase